ncbi:MAG: hypothetical protein WD734_05620 [Dehalococcoidia bacterium]
MSTRQRQDEVRRGPWFLLFAVFGGTVSWTVHLIASYTVANYLCGNAAAAWVLHALTILAGGTAIAAVSVAAFELRRVLSKEPDEQTLVDHRTQFLVSGGVLLGLLGLLAIVLGEVAVVVLGCG